MIIKISYPETVCPTGEVARQVKLISGIDEVLYEKVTVADEDELDDLARQFTCNRPYLRYGPKMPPKDDQWQVEVVLIQGKRNGAYVHEYIAASFASVFFMNDNGKTVDKASCACSMQFP